MTQGSNLCLLHLLHWQVGANSLPLIQGLTVGCCLALRNELSEETHVLTKQEILLGRAPGGEQWGKGAQEDCSAMWLTVGFYGDGINFRVVFGQWF